MEYEKKSDEYIDNIETRLRLCLKKHRAFLNNLTVSPSVSSDSLTRDVASIILMENTTTTTPIKPKTNAENVVLAAIDVEKYAVNGILERIADHPVISGMISRICHGLSLSDLLKDPSQSLSHRFTINNHVTLVHVTDVGLDRLTSTFGPFVGQNIELAATGILWNDRVMALAVDFAPDTKVPTEYTSFPHITVWVAEGAKAFESKDLLKLWQENKAEKLDFGSTPHSLSGVVSLWPGTKSSFS